MSGYVTLAIGREHSEESPVRNAVIGQPEIAPINNLAAVPALPKLIISEGSLNPPTPTPETNQQLLVSREIFTPSFLKAETVAITSSLSSKPEIFVFPTAKDPIIKAR